MCCSKKNRTNTCFVVKMSVSSCQSVLCVEQPRPALRKQSSCRGVVLPSMSERGFVTARAPLAAPLIVAPAAPAASAAHTCEQKVKRRRVKGHFRLFPKGRETVRERRSRALIISLVPSLFLCNPLYPLDCLF